VQIVTLTIPVLHLNRLPRSGYSQALSDQAIACPPFGDVPFVWGGEAVLVDRVEHLSVSVMICTGLLIWQSAHNSSNAAKLLSATTTIVRVGNHRRTCLPSVWPNPSTACVDDFAVHGSVVLGLRLLETVMPTPAVPRELAPIRLNHRSTHHGPGYHWNGLGHDRYP